MSNACLTRRNYSKQLGTVPSLELLRPFKLLAWELFALETTQFSSMSRAPASKPRVRVEHEHNALELGSSTSSKSQYFSSTGRVRAQRARARVELEQDISARAAL